MKSSNLRPCQAAHRTKDWANTRGELACRGQAHPPPEAGGLHPEPEGKGQTQPQRWHPLPNCEQAPQLLTKSSWDTGRLTSAGRVAARDQLPRGDTRHTWDCAPTAHPGNRAAGTREVMRPTAPPGACALAKHPVAWSCLDLGRAQNAGPTEVVPLWSTREPEPQRHGPGKCSQPRARLRQLPCTATWSLSSVDRESTHSVSGANPVWPRHCEHSPHTPVIFAVFLPPRSTTEQVSLNKGPPSPLVSGQKSDTNETCKQRKSK